MAQQPQPSTTSNLLDFAYLGKMDEFLQRLNDLAMHEDWNYVHIQNDRPYPILYNYIKHTFSRVWEQGKLMNVGDFYCFNTGLVTPNQQEIYTLFKRYPSGVRFLDFHKDSDNRMSYYQPLPERATYFDDPADLIFDNRWQLRVNIDHIIEDPVNFERFPNAIKGLPKLQLINTFNGAIEHAKKRVARNYKTAIPQFYRGPYLPQGQLQLLLPLCLQEHAKADLALTVYKDKGGFYAGRTCLTLDMAINNARLIAKPDDEWLKP